MILNPSEDRQIRITRSGILLCSLSQGMGSLTTKLVGNRLPFCSCGLDWVSPDSPGNTPTLMEDCLWSCFLGLPPLHQDSTGVLWDKWTLNLYQWCVQLFGQQPGLQCTHQTQCTHPLALLILLTPVIYFHHFVHGGPHLAPSKEGGVSL